MLANDKGGEMQKTTTFLLFAGKQAGRAEEAMKFYTSLFPQSKIEAVTHYQADEPGGKKGMVKHATFTLQGQEYMAIDSTAPHSFTFAPSISIFVHCEDDHEIDSLFAKLVEGGSALMPLNSYGFSKRFGWVNDKFGISWQLNLGDLHF